MRTSGDFLLITNIVALSSKTPLWEEVGDMYDPSKERIRDQNYWIDCQLKK